MKLGMVGLGKMGANMAERLVKDGHDVHGFDLDTEAVREVEDRGVEGADSLESLVDHLGDPRILWLMVPAGAPVDDTIERVIPLVEEGDVLVDGGNSNYKDSLRRANRLRKQNLHFVDVGTSGGVWGLEEGYSMMVGGEEEIVRHMRPLFESLAPGPEKGWGRVGPPGSGHFVKMVHNGIEYGMMEAFSEGFAIMDSKEEFELDLHQIAEIWRFGSVIRSWLLDLTARALEQNPTLEGIAPYVEDSGEGRWTVFEAIDQEIPAPVITLALQQRLRSRLEDSFSDRLLAAMRNQFGGHAVRTEENR